MLANWIWALLTVITISYCYENCWEGNNCTYCEVPNYYNSELQIIPQPWGYKINDGMTATVYCKTRGHTFINSVLAVDGVDESEIYSTGGVKISCSKGVITPAVFEDDVWCKFGCPKIPDITRIISYPDLTYQTDLALAPVYTDSTKEIKVSCKLGYTAPVGDTGLSSVRCTSTGYTNYIKSCVKGCNYPLTEGDHTLSVYPNYERGYPYFSTSSKTPVNVKCSGSSKTIPLYCLENKGWINTALLSCSKVTSGSHFKRIITWKLFICMLIATLIFQHF